MGNSESQDRSRHESRVSNARLYPVGIETIGKVLSTITSPEELSLLAQKEHAIVEAENPGLSKLLQISFNKYQTKEQGVGRESFLAFYEGAMLVHRLLRQQATEQIPVFIKETRRDDVANALETEAETIVAFATRFVIHPSAVEEISYQRIRNLTTSENDGEESKEAYLGNALLAQAHTHADGNAFLVGAASILFPVIDLWSIQEANRLKIQEQTQWRRRIQYLSTQEADDPEILAATFKNWTESLTEDLAHTYPIWRH